MNELSIFDSLFNNSMDSIFSGRPYRPTFVPKVDVSETDTEYQLDMELPGRDEKNVNIELDHNTLTISSKTEEVKEEKSEDKESEKEAENKPSTKWIIKERRSSAFSRSFTVPEDVDGEHISAHFKNGILNVTMPRKALPSPKKIQIECA